MIFYGDEGREKLRTFVRICEQQFRTNPDVYTTDEARVVMASGFLQGELAEAWERLHGNDDPIGMTWAEFKEFLLDELVPAAQRGWTTGRQWNDLRQRHEETVRQFVSRLEQLHDTITIERSEPERCEKFLYGLRLEIFDRLVQLREAQLDSFNNLVESAT
jgi:hypothetical protein